MPKIPEEIVDLKLATAKDAKKAIEIMYPEISVHLAVDDDVIDVEQAKELLGWEEETDDVKFGKDYATMTISGVKVRLTKNTRNRPLVESWVDDLAQEHLNRRWRLNGETIIIGKSGEVISGQHRLISLIRADERRQLDEEAEHWATIWDGPVTMEGVIVFGVDEADDVINTTDGGMPRTLGDKFYRLPELAEFATKERKQIARAMDNAVKMIWSRTGKGDDAFAITRTHSESIAFFRDHPRLLGFVSHVLTEDEKDGPISRHLPIGYASGLCYLFAASDSSKDDYVLGGRRESALKMAKKRIDQAEDFFALLKDGPELAELRKALDKVDAPRKNKAGVMEEPGEALKRPEKIALLVKAWTFWSAGETVTSKRIELQYVDKGGDLMTIDETPQCGGIDMGDAKETMADEQVVAEVAADKQRELEDRKREEKERSIAATRDDKKPTEDEYDQLRAKHPKHVLWFEGRDAYSLFGPDADLAHSVIGCKMSNQKINGRNVVRLIKNQYQPAMTALNEAGHEVAIVRKTDDGIKVERMKPIVAAKAKKPAKK